MLFRSYRIEPQMDSEPHPDYAGQSGRQQYISTGSGRTSLTNPVALSVEVWAKNRNSDIVRIDEHMMARYEDVAGKKVWDLMITTDQKLKSTTAGITGGNVQIDQSDSAISNIHEWHMYTYTFNAGTVKLYDNGSLINSTQSGQNISSMEPSALEELTIGGGSSVGTWQGSISNAKIYDKVLTAAEVLHNYNTMKLRF